MAGESTTGESTTGVVDITNLAEVDQVLQSLIDSARLPDVATIGNTETLSVTNGQSYSLCPLNLKANSKYLLLSNLALPFGTTGNYGRVAFSLYAGTQKLFYSSDTMYPTGGGGSISGWGYIETNTECTVKISTYAYCSGTYNITGTAVAICLNQPHGEDAAAAATKAELLLAAHPVGSLYWSSKPDNPAGLFGGTWTQIQDQFILAAGSTFTPGSSGGNKDATVVAHSHSLSSNGYAVSNGSHEHSISGSISGGSHAHNMGGNIWSNGGGSSAAYVMSSSRAVTS